MFLSIKNTGKISSAEIELKGITVMAGVNNTGKSTVGKVLFCLFNSFYRIEQQIEQERIRSIGLIIVHCYRESTNRMPIRYDPDEIAENLLSKKADYVDINHLMEDLRELLIQADKSYEKNVNNEALLTASKKIAQILSVSDEDIFIIVFKKRLQAEFNMQINNIYRPGLCSEIELVIKNKAVKVAILDDEYIKIENQYSLNTEVIYLDDPLALDDPRASMYSSGNHREHLRLKLMTYSDDSPVKDAFDEIITTKRLETVFKKLNHICKGELFRKSNTPRLDVAYRENNSEIALDIKNVSTGLKTFVIVKTLLLNGSLEENGIIVLDEPEIHLHPEWQVKFAELIVLLQKEFNMHILLNTHSNYFLDAIEVYSHIYGISEKCKYYLAEDHDGIATISNVSDSIEKIYNKLARPLQVLEDMRYPDDMH